MRYYLFLLEREDTIIIMDTDFFERHMLFPAGETVEQDKLADNEAAKAEAESQSKS